MFNKIIGSTFLLILLSACGGGGSGGGTTSSLSISSASLSFAAQIGGSAPSSQSITIAPNKSDALIPDIIATGDAISFGSTSSCVGGNTANLDCTRTGDDIIVTVPVPDPDSLGIGSHTGSILIESSESSFTVTVSYTVSGATPMVNQVSPYLSEAGLSHSVTIRGGGFSNFGTTNPTVSFGATAGTNATVVNDSTITVDIPSSLTAGSYSVSVTGITTSFPSTANLVVVNTPTYAAATIAQGSVPRLKYVYDDERQLLFAVNAVDGVIEQYTYSGTAWNSTPVTLALTGGADIVLSTDGATLFAVKHDNNVYEIDPDTLALRSTVELKALISSSLNCSIDHCFDTAAISSDGSGAFLDSNQFREIYFYDDKSNTVISSPDAGYEDNTISIWNAKLYRSRSGDRILIDGASNDYIFDSIEKNTTLISNVTGTPIALNGDGRVIVSGTSVLKDSGNGYIAYGTLPTTPTKVAVSLDGNTAYVYADPVLKVYDISAVGTATQIGSDISLAATPGFNTEMAVAADGSTVFIAGADNIVVVPIP